jgi:hypothetical protein
LKTFWKWIHKLKMILKNENDFEKLNEFEKWKWILSKVKTNLKNENELEYPYNFGSAIWHHSTLSPALSIATPRQPTSHWWLCRWFQPARPSAILSALAGRCWPPLPPQRPPLKSLSTAGRVLPYTKISYTIQRVKSFMFLQ